MSLNIKDHETDVMIRELAALHGDSLTATVKSAVREKLEKDKAELDAAKQPGKKSRYELLMEFADMAAPLFTDGRTSKELIDELYDEETGLPK